MTSSALGSELLPEDLGFVLPTVVNAGKKEPYDVYIGRTFAGRVDQGWGNPTPVRSNSAKARVEAVVAYARMLEASTTRQARLGELSGKTLGCWCSPLLCHGHVLALAAAGVDYAGLAANLEAEATGWPKRLLISGSHLWIDEQAMEKELSKVLERWGRHTRPVLVEGGAKGADRFAAEWWRAQGLEVETHEADWATLGKRAGHVRNAEMIKSGVDGLLAFPAGTSPGTRGCIKLAAKAGIPTITVEIPAPKPDSPGRGV